MADWFVGYSPPPETYHEFIDKSVRGIDTFKSLSAAQAKDPKNIEVIFKLAGKQSDLYRADKAAELYKQVLALDPDGTKGTTTYNDQTVTYTQLAEFQMGTAAISARPPDPALLQAFIKKYPDADIVQDAYSRQSFHFLRTAGKEEAAVFFEAWAKRFPNEIAPLTSRVQRILLDKGPADKGIELAMKAIEMTKALPRPAGADPAASAAGAANLRLNLSRLYTLKGDKDKAVAAVDAAKEEAGPNPRMASSLALGYLEAGVEDKALAVYGPAFAKANAADAAQLSSYAQFWARQDKNLNDALAAAKKAAELGPDAYANWIAVANVQVKLKNAAEAEKAAAKALDVAPEAMKTSVQRLVDQVKTQIQAIK